MTHHEFGPQPLQPPEGAISEEYVRTDDSDTHMADGALAARRTEAFQAAVRRALHLIPEEHRGAASTAMAELYARTTGGRRGHHETQAGIAGIIERYSTRAPGHEAGQATERGARLATNGSMEAARSRIALEIPPNRQNDAFAALDELGVSADFGDMSPADVTEVINGIIEQHGSDEY